ncbi:Predicted nucleotidyltransferase [Eubacterium ruminantium]|nr:Predicted nucleotidyltransferase [Eubacterium ruminantium]
MSTVAIVAEYNPFHNGHLYHLNEAKRLSNAEKAFAVMSGNFVQRGEPAILNKLARAGVAVKNGLDLIFELPVRYSTSGAQDFSFSAVEMINSLGIADHIAFGAETNDINRLYKISECLTKESCSFKTSLNDHLKEGHSFPKARSMAVIDEIGDDYTEDLSSPNNILAIEYISALTRLDSDITPVIIPRKGISHDSDVTSGEFASGKRIRELIVTQDKEEICLQNSSINTLLPENTYEGTGLLREFISTNDISALLNLSLINLQHGSDEFTPDSILDINETLFNKIKKLKLPMSYEDIIQALKTREMTEARIRRVLLHIILGIKDIKPSDSLFCPYATLLAFRRESSELLKKAADKSKIEIVNKRSAYKPADKYTDTLYEYDKKATDIYNLLYHIKTGKILPNELSSNSVII